MTHQAITPYNNDMSILILNCTLNESKTFRLAKDMHAAVNAHTQSSVFQSLSTMPIPICDGGASFSNESVQALQTIIQSATGVILASPIYNYSVNSALKSLIEHWGRTFQEKPIGFCCTAGAEKSYMSLLPTMNSMMLDFRCIVYPRFVYVPESSFASDGRITDTESLRRIASFAEEFTQFTHRLSAPL